MQMDMTTSESILTFIFQMQIFPKSYLEYGFGVVRMSETSEYPNTHMYMLSTSYAPSCDVCMKDRGSFYSLIFA